jgi:hypothetical protein
MGDLRRNGIVLLDRIRVALESLKGGLFPSELAVEMAPRAHRKDRPRLLRGKLTMRVKDCLGDIDLEAVVEVEKAVLKREWSDPEKWLCLAPGAESLAAVFNRLGSENEIIRGGVELIVGLKLAQ